MGAAHGEALADAVRRARGNLRLSQRELATRADVSFETVQAIEKARRSSIRPKTKAKFEEALGKEPGWFDYVLEHGAEPTEQAGRSSLVPTRERIAAMSREQIFAIADLIREVTGSKAAAYDFIDGAERVKADLKREQRPETG